VLFKPERNWLTTRGDLNFHYFKPLSLNNAFLFNVHQVMLYNPPFTVIMNGIFANYICFAHSPTNFIFWLSRLIFLVSIISHSDKIIPQNETTQHSKLLWRNIYFSLLFVANIPSISYEVHWWKQTEFPQWIAEKSKGERRVPRSSE
jgi:hypothetical protein